MDENRELKVHDIQQIDDLSRPPDQARPISLDKLLSAVANEHRRAIINSLYSASDKTLEYDALVDRVAETLRNEGAEQLSDEHHRRVRIALHHTHLPKLEEVRIVDYQSETGLVQFVGGTLEHDLLTVIESYDASQ